MRLSVAIQHHPSRAHLIPPLLEQLPDAEVVVDPKPEINRGPWRTYRVALESTPPEATHRLVVQDDAILCANFLVAAERAVAARPEEAVVFFHGKFPQENVHRLQRARVAGVSWAELNVQRWIPVVAVAWPRELALGMVEFVDAQSWPAEFIADDEIAGRFAREAHMRAWATVPSLVEHPDEPSIGRRPQASLNGRRAVWFVGDGDALAVDWSCGA